MIPGVRTQGFSSFYGKAVPRPMGNLDALGNLLQSTANPLPAANAPLLDWSTKVDWSSGGAIMPRPIGMIPKKPLSAQGAFAAYKTRLLREQHPDLPRKSLKRLVEEKAGEEWSKLEDAEKQIFETLAEEDADRYAREMEEFKQSNPGWVKWHEAQLELEKKINSDKKPAKPAARKPRAPLTPWMAYVKSQVQKRLSADPSLKPGLQLTAQVIKETAPKWRNLSDRSRQKWIRIAKADQQRFDAELVNFPEYAQKLKEKAAKKAERKAAKAAAKQKKRKAPGGQTGEVQAAANAAAPAAGKPGTRKRKGGPAISSTAMRVAGAVTKRVRVTRQTAPPQPAAAQTTDAAKAAPAKTRGRKAALVSVPPQDPAAPPTTRKTQRQAAGPSGQKEGGRASKRLQSMPPGDLSVLASAAKAMADKEGLGAEDGARGAAVVPQQEKGGLPAGGEASKPLTPERPRRAGLRLRARRLAGMRTEEAVPAPEQPPASKTTTASAAEQPPASKTTTASGATSAQEGTANDNMENIPPAVPSPVEAGTDSGAKAVDSCGGKIADEVVGNVKSDVGGRAVAGKDGEHRGPAADGGHVSQVVKETRKLFGKLPSSTRAPLEPIQAAPSPSSADSSTEEGFLVGHAVSRSFWVDGVATPFDGTVVSYNLRTKWYRVVYSDGDEEDLALNELQPFLVDATPNAPSGPVRTAPPSAREADVAAGALVGRSVKRGFWVGDVATLFDGMVTAYNPKTQWYRVVYSDGDQEDLTAEEVQPFLAWSTPVAAIKS